MDVFVGRTREMEELLAGLDEAAGGSGRLFLISGEPGIGKSRLADELAGRARERGMRVLWGRCWEAGGAPPYWPWVQSLRSYLRKADPEALAQEIGAGASDLALILPELRELLPGLPEPPTLDPESSRFRLFDATTSFLRRAAERLPTVLILDDVHAADVPSLLMLEFLASELGGMRVLVSVGYRDVDPALEDPLASTLGRLARGPVARRLPLGGLPEGDVARFVELTTGNPPSKGLVSSVYRETEGNPLFVEEVVRLLASEGRLGGKEAAGALRPAVPEGVREVIARRLAGLSDGCRRLLARAAVLGREFDLALLARVTGREPEDSMRTLDEAAAARVVAVVPAVPGRMRFAHALVRDALYEEISPTQRARLHGEAGKAIRATAAADPDLHLAEIAHHFFEAIPVMPPDGAVEFARRAGDRAIELLAYEEAIRLYEMAVGALERTERPAEDVRCELELALGEAQMKAGDGPGSKETFLRAARVARRIRSPGGLARAALGYGGRYAWLRAGADERLVPLLEEALATVGEGDPALRTRLLARLSGALRDELSRDRREALSMQAVEAARRLGDPSALAYALVARFTAIWGPENTEDLLEIASEIVRLGEEAAEPERTLEGHHLGFAALLILGDRAGADAELEVSARISQELRQAPQDWYVAVHRNTMALLEGRFSESELLLHGILETARPGTMDAEVTYRLQAFGLRKEQARLEEVETEIRRSVDEFPWYPMFRCVLAHVHAQLGREREARAALEDLAREDFGVLPRDVEWLFGMSLLPEVAAFLDDPRSAAVLYELVTPYAGLVAFSPPELCLGAVSRGLGILATVLSRFDEAEAHLGEALETNERLRAPPWAARTRVDHARMLLRRDGPGDRERAAVFVEGARRAARELGMVRLLQEIEALEGTGGPAAPVVSREVPGGAARPRIFRHEGEYWGIAFEGDAFRLRDTKGLRYLARLLRNPGVEVHVLDLAAEGGDPVPPRGVEYPNGDLSRRSGGESEALLDPEARAAYRRRLEELRVDLEEAEGWSDAERASRAREEMEFLARELAGATGLGGRARQAPSTAERARQSVTKALRNAMKRIDAESPALGGHLRATVHTGMFCSYVPDPRAAVSWSF